MEPEGSLPQSQVPATYPYPEPGHSPYLHTTFPEDSSTPGSPKWLFPSGFPPKTLYTSLLSPPHTNHMTHPSHSSRFDHPNNIGRGIQIIKLLIMQFSPLPCHLDPLRIKYSSQHPIL